MAWQMVAVAPLQESHRCLLQAANRPALGQILLP